jgi:hypothetical protein
MLLLDQPTTPDFFSLPYQTLFVVRDDISQLLDRQQEILITSNMVLFTICRTLINR